MSSGVFRQYPPPQQRAPSIAPFFSQPLGVPPVTGPRAEFVRREESRMPMVQRNGIAALLSVAAPFVPPPPIQAAVFVRPQIEVVVQSVSEFGGSQPLDAPFPFTSTQPQRRDSDFPYHELQSIRTLFTQGAAQTFVPPTARSLPVVPRWPYESVFGRTASTAAQPLDAPIQGPQTLPQRRDSDFPYHEVAGWRTYVLPQTPQTFVPPASTALQVFSRWPYAELVERSGVSFVAAQSLDAPLPAFRPIIVRRDSDFSYALMTQRPMVTADAPQTYVPPALMMTPLASRWPYAELIERQAPQFTLSQSLDAPIPFVKSVEGRRDSDFPYHELQTTKPFFTPSSQPVFVPPAQVFVPQTRSFVPPQPSPISIAAMLPVGTSYVPPALMQVAINLRVQWTQQPNATRFVAAQPLAGYVPPAKLQPFVATPWPYAQTIQRFAIRLTNGAAFTFFELPPTARVFAVSIHNRFSAVPRTDR